MAVDVLKSKGVPEDRILFLNLIASPEGIRNFATKFPKLRVVTAFVDQVRLRRVGEPSPLGSSEPLTWSRDSMRRSMDTTVSLY